MKTSQLVLNDGITIPLFFINSTMIRLTHKGIVHKKMCISLLPIIMPPTKHLASDAHRNVCRLPCSWAFILQVLSHMRTDNEAMTNTVNPDVKPCSLVGVQWCCGGTYFVHLLSLRVSQARSKHHSKVHLFGLLFDLEMGGGAPWIIICKWTIPT